VSWLRTIVREVIALFVDDGVFALAIVVWLAVIGVLALQGETVRPWAGLALFAGLAAILAVSVSRRAGK
jgi:hypothetical protein